MRKKNYILMFLLAMMVSLVSAQNPWSITHSRNDVPAASFAKQENGGYAQAGVSLRNLWIGSSVLWNVDDNAPIESPGVNGSLLYTLYSNERFALPIWGTIGLNSPDSLLSPDDGVAIGLYPWYELSSTGAFSLVLHGGVGYRRYTAESGDLTEVKLMAGLEVAISPNGGLPTTLSIAPVYRLNQGDLPNRTALEITGILPIGNGLGFMAEGNFPFDNDVEKSLFRLGVLVNGKL